MNNNIIPYRVCIKYGKMGNWWAYCPSCSKKIKDEYDRKIAEKEDNKRKE